MTHQYCIICGKSFEPSNPEVVICPTCSGFPPVPPAGEKQQVIQPAQDPLQAADNTWQPGQVILDTYEVKGILGKGGFGRVYRVHHKSWNMDLAVKRALNLDEQGKQAFIDEAQKWIDLGLHPHIISCYYVRNIDGFPHTFAELAEGGSLHDWIERDKGNLYEGDHHQILARILDIAIQFAWGLGHAHDRDLIHGDVKPQNALMTSEGVLKVTDFGLARAGRGVWEGEAIERELDHHNIVFSPYHCSPEQRMGKALSLTTDIWSWAVSVLEMFNGGISWMGGQVAGSALESYLQRAGGEEAIPPMPPAVAELLRGCFWEDPQIRLKDMLLIADRLTGIYRAVTGNDYFRMVPQAADLLADSLNNNALSMLDLGKPEVAEALFEQAVEADGQHVDANYNLGLLRWRSGRMADVDLLQKLQQIEQDKPEDSGLASALGWVCMESGRFQEALAYFEQAGQLGGDSDSENGVRLARPLAENGAGACLQTFEGHTNWVNSVAFSPDGHQALSGSWDKTLKLWDLAQGACLRTFEGHTSHVYSVAISPDGRQALSGSYDKTLKLWDLAQGACLRTFEGHTGEVTSVAFSPDGRQALSGSDDKTLKLWNLAQGACLRTFEAHTGGVNSVAISPDGRQALSGSKDKTLKLWDLVQGACLRTLEGHTGEVTSVAFSPDGCQGFSGSSPGDLLSKKLDFVELIKLWDLAEGKCLGTFKGHTNNINSVVISPDGRWALSGSADKTLKLWDLSKGKCLRTFEGHTCLTGVKSVSFSPDKRRALSGSWDNTLKLWDLAWVEENLYIAPLRYAKGLEGSEATRRERTHAAYLEQGHGLISKGQIADALVCLEGARAVVGFEQASTTLALSASLGAKVRIRGFREGWLTQNFEEYTGEVKFFSISSFHRLPILPTYEGHAAKVNSVAISPNGRQALSGSDDATLKLWDLTKCTCLRTFQVYRYGVTSVAFSPDGRQALSGGQKKIKLWDLAQSKCLRTFEGHTDWVHSVAFSLDGRQVLSGGADWTLKLWDLVTGMCLHTFEGHTGIVYSVAISPDGRQALSGSGEKTLKLWDLVQGACLRTFEGHTDWVHSVAFSPDGRQALSGSRDKTLKLWDLAQSKCLRTFEGHTDWVHSVAFSPDGTWALSGSDDETIKLWDLTQGACLRTLEGHTDHVLSVAFSPDGRQVLSGSEDRTLKLWNLEWNYEFPGWIDWDEGARPYLETFLSLHTPYAGELPQDRKPSKEEIQLALTRRGKPTWTEDDFKGLLTQLGHRGFGWLREEGVRRKLEEMAGRRA